MQVIAWDLTGEYVIIYNEEELRQLLGKTGTVLSGEINHKPFYYQMKVGTPVRYNGTPTRTAQRGMLIRRDAWADLGLVPRPRRRLASAVDTQGSESLEASHAGASTPVQAGRMPDVPEYGDSTQSADEDIAVQHRGSPDEEVKAVKRLQRGVYRRRAAAPAPESDAASTVSLYGSELEPESATGPDPISSPALDTLLTAGRDGGTVSSCSNWCNTAIPPNPFPSTATPYTPLQLAPMPAPLSMPERLGYPDPCIYQAATNILRFQAQPAPVTREEELITIRVTRAQARLLHVLLQWHLDLGAGLQGTPAAELSEGYERSG